MSGHSASKKQLSLKSHFLLQLLFITAGLAAFSCVSYLSFDAFFSDQALAYKKISSSLDSATLQSLNQSLHQGKSQVFQIVFSALVTVSLLILAGTYLLYCKLRNSTQGSLNNLNTSSSSMGERLLNLQSTSRELTSATSSTAGSLEQTVAALEQLSSMVKMNSNNAHQAASLSLTTSKAAQTGETEMSQLIQSIKCISDSSKKIEDIINVIDDIAFQTNLLALNASVEAARAGEQGKGFSVVAEAVRALSQRSATSAKDIETLIKQSVEQINQGRELANKSSLVFSDIVKSIKKVSDLNNEISTASEEQAAGLSQLNHAMNQIDSASQANSVSTENILTTVEAMTGLSATSQAAITELQYFLGINNRTPAPQAPLLPLKTEKSAPASKPRGIRSAEASSKVIPLKKSVKPQAPLVKKELKASDIIPFDEDERAKVGTTDDF